tara:strand:- start:429 stop:596 length:168 start_codon:yes stop_codon:yes gene_type:complete
MDYIMTELQILLAFACIAGCGWTSWKLGHYAGIISALDYLESQGLVSFDEEKNKA